MAQTLCLRQYSGQAFNIRSKIMEQKIGKSLIWYGIFGVLGTVAAAFVCDSVNIDLLIIVVIILGIQVREGNRSGGKWSLAIMSHHSLAGFIILAIILSGHYEDILDKPGGVREYEVIFTGVLVLIVSVWALVNGIGLYKYLVGTRDRALAGERPIYMWIVVPMVIVGGIAGLGLVWGDIAEKKEIDITICWSKPGEEGPSLGVSIRNISGYRSSAGSKIINGKEYRGMRVCKKEKANDSETVYFEGYCRQLREDDKQIIKVSICSKVQFNLQIEDFEGGMLRDTETEEVMEMPYVFEAGEYYLEAFREEGEGSKS
jgi:hypothetical protein